MDDDIATGRTIRAFQDLLPPRIVIDRVLSMQEVFTTVGLRTVECSEADRIVEAGDLRDFLVGARDGGLVVLLPDGSCARAPYLLPYVHNNRRMSIPHSEELAFSKRVWELNAQFHENLPRAITVGDCPMPFQNLARYVGFSPATTLGEFCRWHLGQLGEVGDVDD
jgi:hypothetical protein